MASGGSWRGGRSLRRGESNSSSFWRAETRVRSLNESVKGAQGGDMSAMKATKLKSHSANSSGNTVGGNSTNSSNNTAGNNSTYNNTSPYSSNVNKPVNKWHFHKNDSKNDPDNPIFFYKCDKKFPPPDAYPSKLTPASKMGDKEDRKQDRRRFDRVDKNAEKSDGRTFEKNASVRNTAIVDVINNNTVPNTAGNNGTSKNIVGSNNNAATNGAAGMITNSTTTPNSSIGSKLVPIEDKHAARVSSEAKPDLRKESKNDERGEKRTEKRSYARKSSDQKIRGNMEKNGSFERKGSSEARRGDKYERGDSDLPNNGTNSSNTSNPSSNEPNNVSSKIKTGLTEADSLQTNDVAKKPYKSDKLDARVTVDVYNGGYAKNEGDMKKPDQNSAKDGKDGTLNLSETGPKNDSRPKMFAAKIPASEGAYSKLESLQRGDKNEGKNVPKEIYEQGSQDAMENMVAKNRTKEISHSDACSPTQTPQDLPEETSTARGEGWELQDGSQAKGKMLRTITECMDWLTQRHEEVVRDANSQVYRPALFNSEEVDVRSLPYYGNSTSQATGAFAWMLERAFEVYRGSQGGNPISRRSMDSYERGGYSGREADMPGGDFRNEMSKQRSLNVSRTDGSSPRENGHKASEIMRNGQMYTNNATLHNNNAYHPAGNNNMTHNNMQYRSRDANFAQMTNMGNSDLRMEDSLNEANMANGVFNTNGCVNSNNCIRHLMHGGGRVAQNGLPEQFACNMIAGKNEGQRVRPCELGSPQMMNFAELHHMHSPSVPTNVMHHMHSGSMHNMDNNMKNIMHNATMAQISGDHSLNGAVPKLADPNNRTYLLTQLRTNNVSPNNSASSELPFEQTPEQYVKVEEGPKSDLRTTDIKADINSGGKTSPINSSPSSVTNYRAKAENAEENGTFHGDPPRNNSPQNNNSEKPGDRRVDSDRARIPPNHDSGKGDNNQVATNAENYFERKSNRISNAKGDTAGASKNSGPSPPSYSGQDVRTTDPPPPPPGNPAEISGYKSNPYVYGGGYSGTPTQVPYPYNLAARNEGPKNFSRSYGDTPLNRGGYNGGSLNNNVHNGSNNAPNTNNAPNIIHVANNGPRNSVQSGISRAYPYTLNSNLNTIINLNNNNPPPSNTQASPDNNGFPAGNHASVPEPNSFENNTRQITKTLTKTGAVLPPPPPPPRSDPPDVNRAFSNNRPNPYARTEQNTRGKRRDSASTTTSGGSTPIGGAAFRKLPRNTSRIADPPRGTPTNNRRPANDKSTNSQAGGDVDLFAKDYKKDKKEKMPEKIADKNLDKAPEKIPDKYSDKSPEKTAEKLTAKTGEKMCEKPTEKIAEKTQDKTCEKTPEKILDTKTAEKASEKKPDKAPDASVERLPEKMVEKAMELKMGNKTSKKDKYEIKKENRPTNEFKPEQLELKSEQKLSCESEGHGATESKNAAPVEFEPETRRDSRNDSANEAPKTTPEIILQTEASKASNMCRDNTEADKAVETDKAARGKDIKTTDEHERKGAIKARIHESNIADENKSWGNRTGGNRWTEAKLSENRSTTDTKTIESRTRESKMSENKNSENICSENKSSANTASENKSCETKSSENKHAENKNVKNKEVKDKDVENQGAEINPEGKLSENKKIVEDSRMNEPSSTKSSNGSLKSGGKSEGKSEGKRTEVKTFDGQMFVEPKTNNDANISEPKSASHPKAHLGEATNQKKNSPSALTRNATKIYQPNENFAETPKVPMNISGKTDTPAKPDSSQNPDPTLPLPALSAMG